MIISKLDEHKLVAVLNDHELLTLLRRFRAHDAQHQQKKDFYIYPELCDMLSNLYSTHVTGTPAVRNVSSGAVAEFLKTTRMKSLQWRRSYLHPYKNVDIIILICELLNVLEC